jgi:hypothetical protein
LYYFNVAVSRTEEAESHAMKPNTLSLVLFALLTYFVTTLGVEAVSPAPDGCYPNFTTAEGVMHLIPLPPDLEIRQLVFVVRADEKLTAFFELQRAIHEFALSLIM